MALSVINTRASLGVVAPQVSIEVHISNGLPALTLVGLPETTVKEARDRVRSALINCGFTFPPKRITVNLAPADLPKEGGRYDLPIALAILAASEQLVSDKLSQYEFIGELGLSGALRGVNGAIPAAMAAQRRDGGSFYPPIINRKWHCLNPTPCGSRVTCFRCVLFAERGKFARGRRTIPGRARQDITQSRRRRP